MAIVKKKIELSERDIIEIVSEKYGLNPSKTSVSIVGSDHSSHDPRERSAGYIAVEGEEVSLVRSVGFSDRNVRPQDKEVSAKEYYEK